MTNELAEAEIIARTVVPRKRVCAQLGVHDRLLSALLVQHNIPEIRFSQRSRGLLLDHVDKLIAAHARVPTPEPA